jgi:tetratricopeptide (TPR) repeat protein
MPSRFSPTTPQTRSSRRFVAARAGAVCLSVCLCASNVVWAQGPTSASRAQQADAAFSEGRDLFEQGRFREACEKFELSMQLDPSPGTLLNLGNCYEPQGDLVRALSTFERAFADAQHASDAKRRKVWSDAARERIAALAPRVPLLSIGGADADAALSLDGKPFTNTGDPERVNPGHHELTEKAEGKRPFTQAFDIAATEKLQLDLPVLEAEPQLAAAAPAPMLSAPPPDEKRQHRFGRWPVILGASGVALIGTGLATGIAAAAKAKRLDEECTDKQCDPSLQSVKHSAEALARLTDVLWVGGLALMGTGLTLYLIDTGSSSGTTVQAGCFDAGCGLQTTGHF